MGPGGLLWATGVTIESGTRAPSMLLAVLDGMWIFAVTASTPELRFELLEAFCDASTS